ncbi:Asp-tRNA(Asn)/Glu-tRNA(Gln) amidotransferase subunit GatC [Pedomonas mirosovicensis]|uniref:Asp-tRNA(Asn)/Glu-tRNA(Gln) amidotransferase subunit GatC n=1 Tax=Pedomonas mirosovicensis TaxID=2908641 RepID=UPI0021672555|nr:Asp-tRNA(Asn)/Glu-tRNA(Gln) amidotransferase subunit GatC [Pedomonas mirosovicensis]MCH8684898.1 Asp-tRNA(Asn)/Glu-tRNA(Gln) amidotransferase subunit GatC [Pedomonas mirosovicensis]
MAVDEKTVRRIAHLARIKLDDADVEPMMKELNGILDWVEQLGEVNTDGVEPMTSVVAQGLRWREDVVNDGNIQEDVLKNAPEAQFGFYAVPKVIE